MEKTRAERERDKSDKEGVVDREDDLTGLSLAAMADLTDRKVSSTIA